MERKEMIAALAKNEHNPTRNPKALEAMTDDELKALEAHCASVVAMKAASDKAAADLKAAQEAAKTAGERLTAVDAKIAALEANQVTDEMRALVAERRAADEAAKAELVGTLKAAGAFTEDELKAKDVAELRKLAALANVHAAPAASYAGRGVPAPRAAQAGYEPPDPYAAGLKALQSSTVN